MPRVVLCAGLAKKNTNHIPTRLVSPFVGLIGADVVDGTFAVVPLHIKLAGRGEASYVLADGRKGCAKLPQKSSSDLLSTLQLGKHHAYAQIFKPQPSDRERRAEASSTNKPPQRAGQLQSGRMLPNQGCGEQNPNIKVHTSTYLFLYAVHHHQTAFGRGLCVGSTLCTNVWQVSATVTAHGTRQIRNLQTPRTCLARSPSHPSRRRQEACGHWTGHAFNTTIRFFRCNPSLCRQKRAKNDNLKRKGPRILRYWLFVPELIMTIPSSFLTDPGRSFAGLPLVTKIRKLSVRKDFDTLRTQDRLGSRGRGCRKNKMRVFAGHGCGNQNVGPFEPRRRTHIMEQRIRARQASEGLKTQETQERSHTFFYGNTPAESTSAHHLSRALGGFQGVQLLSARIGTQVAQWYHRGLKPYASSQCLAHAHGLTAVESFVTLSDIALG
ncbi:hypothetical protein GE21DRAFT_7306 [Neurospora crassa]|uniref:Uncharacterized protein n=1 Tax=Neurospora crassa (strain ATCC 24698 / 74-OR23-1A / CBS 708.71 / DSM 1257 / FGSC 987) TaxID=367110 RepID=Q7RVU2_NEUCR|nr:hypothetical protein NCU03746 [Neurospora crassa OR74A]EAA31857.3 hypothetical protein NCU03746 [Neurospora crassa OR74A]KHE88189.1 hypothetical protein GE21DRAFT_7306 [Neurospora crassa]|eukprot:XP_961093.3 hypothetical protein NCU03746 [Neurospora crassa OR74A]